MLNSKKSVIMLDRLGNEFNISRNTKQSIFTNRIDLTDEQKHEIYGTHNSSKLI